jgi:transposase
LEGRADNRIVFASPLKCDDSVIEASVAWVKAKPSRKPNIRRVEPTYRVRI